MSTQLPPDTQNKLLSFVIPIYNVEKYLNTCFESILAQDLVDWEAILVNDGSTDASGKICDDWAAKEEHFTVIHQDNKGISSARNHGTQHAHGRYILFIDSDDYLIEGTIKHVLETAVKHNLDMISFDSIAVEANSLTTDTKPVNDTITQIEITSGVNYIASQNYATEVWHYLIRKDFIVENRIEFPIGHMIEDAGYVLRLFIHAQHVAHVPTVCHCYRKHEASIMHNVNANHQLKLLNDYLFAAQDINSIICEHSELPATALERCQTRRDSYIFMGMVRALKLGTVDDFVAQAKDKGLFPFARLSKKDYPGLKFSILHWLVNSPCLWKTLSRVYRLILKQ